MAILSNSSSAGKGNRARRTRVRLGTYHRWRRSPRGRTGRTAAMSNPAFAFDHLHIISQNPKASANWYVQMFGADIVADTVARGAPQIFLELGGKTLIIRSQRPGEAPTAARAIQPYADYSSPNAWGTDHFGFIYHGDLRAKGVRFPVALKEGVGRRLLCYVAAPDGVSIE